MLGLKKEEILIKSRIKEEEILSLINERLGAKKIKNYAKADDTVSYTHLTLPTIE